MRTESAPVPLRDQVATHRVLVVDDEVALADLVVCYLEHATIKASVAHNGLDALRLARNIHPDVVILDVDLPEIDGIEVCRRLRTFSDARVVMLSARGSETDKAAGVAAGADDYMMKPFSPRALVAEVQGLLARPSAGRRR